MMKSKSPHNNDEFLDSQLSALRKVEVPAAGPGSVIQAMSAPLPQRRLQRLIPLGFGSAAVLSAMVIAALTLPATTATARELKMVADAQQAQRIWHRVEYFNNLQGPLKFRDESWNSGQKQCLKMYDEQGQQTGVIGYNGRFSYQWYRGVPGSTGAVMNIDDVKPEESNLVTVSALQAEPVLRSVDKSTGVTENGTRCDLYSFAKGYYRLLVDPARKLPLQMDVYNKGIDLCSRQVYEYPKSVPDKMFDPPSIPGTEVTNYVEARKNLYSSLAHTNSVASSLELAGVVVDASSIYLVMSARATVKVRSVKVDGYQPHPEQIKPLATPDGRQYLVIVLPASPAMGKGFPFGFSVTVDGSAARHFDVSGAVQTPSGERLIWREGPTSQIAKDVQTER